MAIPVLKKNDTTAIEKAREGILQERLDAFEKGISRVISSMNSLDSPSKMKKKQEALNKTRIRLEKQLQDDRLVLASENKKMLQQTIKQLQAEQEILTKEYEVAQTVESKIELEKITKQIEKLENREKRYDKKEKKLEKKFEKKQKGVIGLLNPVAKGILAGGKGIVGAISNKYNENKEGIKSALLGPFSIISGALENAGIDFTKPFSFLKDKIGGLFSKKEKSGKSSFGGKGGRDSKSSKSFDPFSSSTPDKRERSSLLPSFISPEVSSNLNSENISESIGIGKTKTNPSLKDVASIGDMGALLLYNLLNKKAKGKTPDEEDSNFLSTLLGGKGGLGGLLTGGGLAGLLKGGLGKKLITGGAIAAIVGSLVWMAIDGIKGYAKSGEWGVSKAGGVVGAVLGGTSEGLKGAFAGAGKWGLMGAGIGTLIVPGVGTIIGGLIGAAVGGILGFIGGKRIASGFDKLKNWLFENIDFKAILMATPIGAVINLVNNLKSVWGDKDKTIGQKILGTMKEWGKFVLSIVFAPLRFIGSFFTGKFFTKEGKKGLKETAGKLFSGIGSLFSKGISGVADAGIWIYTSVIEPVGKFLYSLFTDPVGTVLDVGKWALDTLITPVTNIIKEGFFKVKDFMPDTVQKLIFEPIEKTFNFIGDLFGFIFSGQFSLVDLIGSIWDKDKSANLVSSFEAYALSRQSDKEVKTGAIKDGIVRSDGSFISISPDDNVYATTNEISTSINSGSSTQTVSVDSIKEDIIDKFDELIRAVIESNKVIVAPNNNLNLDIFKV